MILIILFFHLLFGLWFAYQTYKSSEAGIFPSPVIKTCVFGYLILLLVSSQAPTLWFITAIHLPIFANIIFHRQGLVRRRLEFFNQFSQMMDAIVSRIKMGNSFRQSLKLSIDSIKKPSLREDFKEIQNRVIFSQNLNLKTSKDIRFVFETFKTADGMTQPLNFLYHVKKALKIEALFGRKTHQALIRIHTQSIVLIIFYIISFIFTLVFFKGQSIMILSCSLLLFSVGTWIVFALGRNIKWTL